MAYLLWARWDGSQKDPASPHAPRGLPQWFWDRRPCEQLPRPEPTITAVHFVSSRAVPVSACGLYWIICRHAEQLKIWAIWCAHSNWGQTRWHSALLFQLFYLNKCSCFLLSTFLNFALVCFCQWFHCLNGPQAEWWTVVCCLLAQEVGDVSYVEDTC